MKTKKDKLMKIKKIQSILSSQKMYNSYAFVVKTV